MSMPRPSDIELAMAKSKGHRAGSRPPWEDVECPYGYRDMELRTAWTAGFKEGRAAWEAIRADSSK
jgi:ribosome modulation factor